MMEKNHPISITLVMMALVVVLSLMDLSSCATRIPVQVTRAPTMDTSSIKRLAVMPFKDSDGSSLQKQLASDLTRQATTIVTGTQSFTMVNASTIQNMQNNKEDISLNVDGLLTGEIISVVADDTETQKEVAVKDPKTGKQTGTKIETTYTRKVSLQFAYRLLNARDEIIGEVIKQGEASKSDTSKGNLPQPLALAQQVLTSQLSTLNRDIAPWKETIQLTLEKTDSKDKAVKASMKEAEKAVKEKNFKAAKTLYSQVYKNSEDFAAGYNEALMAQVLGDVNEAISLMSVLAATGNAKAVSELSRMQSDAGQEQLVAENYSNKESPLNKSITEASGAIVNFVSSKFPNGAKTVIMKGETKSQYADLLEYVVTEVTKSLVDNKITVVDRGQLSSLIDMEKNYQTSGAVSDNDMVSLGNEYGVNVMLSLSITGSGSMRQLKVSGVSVETKERFYEKTFEI